MIEKFSVIKAQKAMRHVENNYKHSSHVIEEINHDQSKALTMKFIQKLGGIINTEKMTINFSFCACCDAELNWIYE